VLTEVDERLRDEARRFELRFTCESCAHFDPPSGSCASGYPNEPHRGVRLTEARTLVFCKEYELA
jgi:hypothetical protein